MKATYAFSTNNYRYEIIGFEYAIQRIEDKFCQKKLGQTIVFYDVTLEGVLAWSRGDGRKILDFLLKEPEKKSKNYDWAKKQILAGILMKYKGDETEFRKEIMELVKRMERDIKKFKTLNVPQIIYGESD